MRWTVPVSVLVVAPAVAACLGAPGPAGSLDAPVARQPGVDDGERWIVHVEDPAGDPVRGATVVLFTDTEADASTWYAEEMRDLHDGWRLEGVDRFAVLVEGRTGPTGDLVASVDPDAVADGPAPVHVAAGGLQDRTTEVRLTAVDGDRTSHAWMGGPRSRPDGTTEITVVLFPTERSRRIDGTWSTTVVPPRPASHGMEWRPHPLLDALSERRQRAYLARGATVEAEMTWTNGPDSWGDLHLGLDNASREVPRNHGEDPDAGPRDGEVHARLGADLDQDHIAIGPVTDRAVVGEVAYTIDVTMRFEGSALQLR